MHCPSLLHANGVLSTVFIWTWTYTPTHLPSERQTPLPEDPTALMEIAIKGDQDALSILVSPTLWNKASFILHLWHQLHRREGDHCAISGSPNVRNITYHSSLEIPAILKIAHILPHSLTDENEVGLESLPNNLLTIQSPFSKMQPSHGICWRLGRLWTSKNGSDRTSIIHATRFYWRVQSVACSIPFISGSRRWGYRAYFSMLPDYMRLFKGRRRKHL